MTKKMRDYICLALFAAGLAAMFMPSGDSAPGLRSMDQFWNLGHAVLFFLAAHLAYAFSPRLSFRPVYSQALLITAAVILSGAAIELAQSMIPGRFPSFYDAATNLAGALAYLSLRNRKQVKKYIPMHAAAICLIVLALWPPIRAASDDIIAYTRFPVLADFETPFEATRFTKNAKKAEITSSRAYSGSHSLKINLDTDTYSGISMKYMPRNWQEFSFLYFEVYNPQDHPVKLTVRIHDAEHETQPVQQYSDRFNRSFEVPPETWTTIKIPLADIRTAPRTRKLDLFSIQALGMFVTRAPEPWTLYIDHIRLK